MLIAQSFLLFANNVHNPNRILTKHVKFYIPFRKNQVEDNTDFFLNIRKCVNIEGFGSFPIFIHNFIHILHENLDTTTSVNIIVFVKGTLNLLNKTDVNKNILKILSICFINTIELSS